MSDSENVEVKKRGRVAAGDKRSASKKDDKPAVADGETVAKRGRGRPKGTTKKNGGVKKPAKKAAAPAATGKGRGRPAKKKEESTEEENEDNDSEANDDDNDSGSD